MGKACSDEATVVMMDPMNAFEPSLMDQSREQFAGQALGEVETVLAACLDELLPGGWSLESLKGRVVMQVDPHGIETYVLDGKPFLEMHPWELSSDRNVTRVARKYRRLFLSTSHITQTS